MKTLPVNTVARGGGEDIYDVRSDVGRRFLGQRVVSALVVW